MNSLHGILLLTVSEKGYLMFLNPSKVSGKFAEKVSFCYLLFLYYKICVLKEVLYFLFLSDFIFNICVYFYTYFMINNFL